MAKGSGPIQYNELFNNDVDAKLAELSGIVTKLDSEFQGLASTIAAMSGKISVNIKTTNTVLEKMATDMAAVDVATRGAGDQLQAFSKDLETASTKSRNLKDQQKGLKDTFDIATASIDEIKARIKLLTAEYTALGRATDADKTKLASLGKEVSNLKTYVDPLITALNKTKTAIQAADGSYNQMSQRLAALKKELMAMPNAFNPATGAINKANIAAVNLQERIAKLDIALKKVDATMGMHGRNVGNYKSALGGALDSVQSLALSYLSLQGAIMAAGAIFNTAMQTDATKTSLAFILGGEDIADAKLKQLTDTAERLGLEFTSLTASYTSFIGAAKASNFALSEAEGIFNAVSGAGARLHLSADQISGSLLAIQQMISKGTVSAEELRGQLGERLPGAFAIAARAMGVTEMELNDMLKSGEVLASDLLPKLTVELNKTFGLDSTTKIDSMSSAWNRLKNVFSTAVSENSNISKFFTTILTGIGDVASSILKTVNSSSWKEFFLRFGAIAKGGAGNVAGMMVDRTLADNLKSDPKNNKNAGIEAFMKASQLEQIELLKTQTAIRDRAYEVAKSGRKEDIAWANEQQRFLVKIRKLYDDFYTKKVVVEKESDADRKKRLAAEAKAERDREAEAKKAIKDADDLLKAQTKLKIAELEKQEIADLSTATEEQKTAIIIQFEKDKLKIIEDGINAREKLYKKGTVAFIELEVEKEKATVDAQEKIAKATEDGLKRQQALQEKYAKLRNDLLASEGQGAYAAEEFKINSTIYKGNPQQQEAQKQEALYNLRSNALKRELTLVDLRYAHIKDATERELTIKREKQDITNELDQLGYDNFIRLQDLQKAKLDEMFSYLRENNGIIGQLYGQGFGNLFDSLTTNLQKLLDKTGNGIADWAETIKAGAMVANSVFKQGSEERIAQLEVEKQQQMDIAGSNATARLAIEKAFNDKIKAEKIKQARIDKATAIFEIAINTAVAASKATAQTGIFGLPLAAVLIAFGAIQAGLVAAKPLPAFRKGTNYAPEGFARVGEEGAELIEGRRGLRIAHSDQITYLDRGDKVYTAEQTRKILDANQIDSNTELHGRLSSNLHQQSSQQRIREMSIAFRQDPEAIGDAVGRRIKDLPIHQTHFDERGVTRFIRKNGTLTKYLNDRTSLS